jgi:hypothetical protein
LCYIQRGVRTPFFNDGTVDCNGARAYHYRICPSKEIYECTDDIFMRNMKELFWLDTFFSEALKYHIQPKKQGKKMLTDCSANPLS